MKIHKFTLSSSSEELHITSKKGARLLPGVHVQHWYPVMEVPEDYVYKRANRVLYTS